MAHLHQANRAATAHHLRANKADMAHRHLRVSRAVMVDHNREEALHMTFRDTRES
jgi:hypothetical protein